MSKQDLWGVYRVARRRAFTTRTIRSAWRAAGLYPVDPSQPESRIPRPLTPTTGSEGKANLDLLFTPETPRHALKLAKYARSGFEGSQARGIEVKDRALLLLARG